MIWRGEHVLRNPSNAELARADRPARTRAGARARLRPGRRRRRPGRAGRRRLRRLGGPDTVVLDAVATGGQAGTSSRIENYLGFPAGISGRGAGRPRRDPGRQVRRPHHRAGRGDRRCDRAGRRTTWSTSTTASRSAARTVILATGVRYRRLDVPGIERVRGRQRLLRRHPDRGAALPRRPGRGGRRRQLGRAGGRVPGRSTRPGSTSSSARHDLGANMSRYLVDRIERTRNVEVLLHTEVRELLGEDGSSRRSWSRTTGPGSAARSRPRRCSSSSARSRTREWLGDAARPRRQRLRPAPAPTPRLPPTRPGGTRSAAAAAAGDQPARGLRRRRRAQRLGQTGGLGRRRGRHGRPPRPRAPGECRQPRPRPHHRS